jgi:predicted DsbA family dithiol-disulfide isomerase
MRVDVWSDVVCPWCFVGLANLEQAMGAFEHGDEVDVVLHSFELDPHAPAEDPRSLNELLAKKYGTSIEQVEAGQARLVAMGAERGIDFQFDKARRANSFDAHRLLHLAADHGLQLELKHRLGRAYFTDGALISDHDVLRKVAVDAGLDPAEVDAVLESDRYTDAVRRDEAEAHDIGVGGVPFFVFDGRLGLSGAQPPATLRRVLERAWPDRVTGRIEVVDAPTGDGEVCGIDGC